MKKGIKKNPLIEIENEYLEHFLLTINNLYESINNFIEEKKDMSKLEVAIHEEHKCDRLKERYIKELYESKRSLPFLIEDRYKIITSLDIIPDLAEDLARLIRICPFGFYNDIKENIRNLNRELENSSKLISECIKNMETDFFTAYQITFNIDVLKRRARKFKYAILEKLYKKNDNPVKIYLNSKIVETIYEMIEKAENLSDFLRGLIIKYPKK